MTTATLEPQTTIQTPNLNLPSAEPALLFADMDISSSLKSRLAAAQFVTPTPVQAGAIPPALDGRDVLATAATGTGKTLSFLIPMIERMDDHSQPSTKGNRGPIRSLILLPTRELAMQVLDSYAKIGPSARHDAVLVVGGLSENNQLDQIDRGPRLVVATPGRLEDFLRRREIDLRNVEMLVLDEVDRMLDMGFLPAIRRIVQALPRKRQTMCYSATLDANIREIVKDYVHNPVRVEIGTTSKPSDNVHLVAYSVMQDQKTGLLDQMLREHDGTFLVFSRTKHGADRIARRLDKLGHDAAVIHGDRSQSQRTAALKGFAGGKHRILVATDVAARGIDIQDIAHVVNYDLPNAAEDFVHRIGRTGRAGAKGTATTFVMPQERSDMRTIERNLKVPIEWREADRNLEKEERNRPVDLNSISTQNNIDAGLAALLALETRAWKTEGSSDKGQGSGNAPRPGFRQKPTGRHKGGHGNFGHNNNQGGGSNFGRNPAPRSGAGGSRPKSGNRGQ